MANRILVKGGTVITVDPGLGDLPKGDVLVEDGKIVAIGPDLGRRGCGGHRRERPPRHAGPDRHAPPHLAVALPEHRVGLDAGPLLHRPARDDERAVPARGHLRGQPDRHARGARLGHHDARRLVAQPEHAAAHAMRRSTPRSSRAGASCSRTAAASSTGSRRARCRTRPTTCAGSATAACPRTTRWSRCSSRRAGTSSRRWRSTELDWALAERARPADHLPLRRRRVGQEPADRRAEREGPARADDDVRALQHAGRRRAADDGGSRRQRLDLARHRAADGPRLAGHRAAARRTASGRASRSTSCSSNGGHLFGTMRATIGTQRGFDNEAARDAGKASVDLIETTCRDVLEFATIDGARACGLDEQGREPRGRARPRTSSSSAPTPSG